MNSINVTSTGKVITATGLHKSYGRGDAMVRALDGVDIELLGDQVLAIMGASGSGKTTLLHLLAGLLRPDEGSICFDTHDLTQLPDRQLTALRCSKLSVVFQAYNLMPTLAAVDNVALPLLLAGVDRNRARTAALEKLAMVGLEASATRRPAQLSGGEQQRVAIARALVNDPAVLLADEPTGNLDRKNAELVCQLLKEVGANDGRAVALVTHDPWVAAHADRIVVLADGRVVDQFARSAVSSVEELALRTLTVSTYAT